MSAAKALRALARELMLRAFRDLRAHAPIVRDEAISFLTAATPEWAESLETWCAFAGLDPNVVTARSAAYLKEGAMIAAS